MALPETLTFFGCTSPALRLCFALFWAGHLFATDWPQGRGPNRAADWTESGIVEKLPNTGLKVLWRAPLPPILDHSMRASLISRSGR